MTERTLAQLADLERGGLGLSEVTRIVSDLEASTQPLGTTTIGLSGNVTLDLLGTYLRKYAVLRGTRVDVRPGAFADHLGNIKRFVSDGADAIVLIDLFDAFLPAFEARVAELGMAEVGAQAERYRSELALGLKEAEGVRDVFLARPHRLSPPGSGAPDAIDHAIALFDDVVKNEARRFSNVHLLSTGAISARLGWSNAHDVRSYQRFRAPFTPAFLDAIAAEVHDATRGFGSYFYKALVLDCDGTLWGGVLGEDLVDGIKLGPFGYPGTMFWQAQHEFLALQRRGVLLCLCSKNDPADVDDVLARHPSMVLRDEHFVAKRVNWEDKVTNLESLASELNIGLDSMIFLDDSAFECEAVRSRLPMVTTIQVPNDLSEYPTVTARLKRLFQVEARSSDDGAKTEQYRSRGRARDHGQRFADQAEYLASLGIKVEIRRNERASTARIAELTQKSNQFNLTTRRYTAAEIEALMVSEDADVYAIHVADSFGDSGLTGVLITKGNDPNGLRIDSFLLSCRVLGRGVELSFWELIRRDALDRGCRTLVAEYLPTAKNDQVREFWDRLGMDLVDEDSSRRAYRSDLGTLILPAPPAYVEVIDAL